MLLVALIQLVSAATTQSQQDVSTLTGNTLVMQIVYAGLIFIGSLVVCISLACYCGKRQQRPADSATAEKSRLSTLAVSDIALEYDHQSESRISTIAKLSTQSHRFTSPTVMELQSTTMMGNQTTLMTSGNTLALPGFLMFIKDLDFRLSDQFAEGGAGTIYHGVVTNQLALERMKGDNKCVIKVMKPMDDATLDESNALFNNEISITWLLHDCPNIIQLVGYCPQPPMILLRDYAMGSLEDLIHKDKKSAGIVPDNQWTPKFILKMMRDVAAGLADMHDSGLVHNDVKPGNVLLDKNPDGSIFGVVCDFGVTSIIDESLLRVKAYKISRVKGASLVYAPPEVLKDFQDNTDNVEKSPPQSIKAGDIYAYSMLSYELLYRRIPWWDEDDLEVISKSVIQGRRPQLPKSLYERRKKDQSLHLIITIMEKCYHADPMQRTPFSQIVDQINELLGAPRRKKPTTDLALRKQMVDIAKTTTTQGQFRQAASLRNVAQSQSSGQMVGSSGSMQQRAPDSSNSGNGRPKRTPPQQTSQPLQQLPPRLASQNNLNQAIKQQQPQARQQKEEPFRPILPPSEYVDTIMLTETSDVQGPEMSM